jgi:diguanylate cyclase (GGDEF)-like protein
MGEGNQPATTAISKAPPPLHDGPAAALAARLESYRRLADVFHDVLAEQSLDSLLDRIADTLAGIIPYDTLTIYEANEVERLLVPVYARDDYAREILDSIATFGEGITGWSVENRQAVLANEAHNDPRVVIIPGTPLEEEALISVPLIARGSIKGALNIYRTGQGNYFTDEELELAKRVGDAAALALDNAQSRVALERLAQTDSLTGVYNHRFFHERLRAELTRAIRVGDCVTVLMLDIDDFKRLNDVYSHAVGDQVLVKLAEMLREMIRGSDVPCRLGGEEFAVIMPSSGIEDAQGLAQRFMDRLASVEFAPAGRVTLSVGVASGPEQAMNARELAYCAEAAMMTAKAQGKDHVVIYEPDASERPDAPSETRDVRSISHLKMLQSVAGKLNRLNDVREIGMTIATELRTLIDYHNCRVYVRDGNTLDPIALMSSSARDDERAEDLRCEIGEGITGRAAELNKSLLISNALECDFAVDIPGTEEIAESIVAVPLSYGTRVIGVVVLSSLGVGQFDEDDVRLMEVLAGNASVALENARLYEAQRHEAETAKALLELSDAMAHAPSLYAVEEETVKMAARLLDSTQSSLWLQDEASGEFRCAAHLGYVGDPTAESLVRMVVSREQGERFLDGRRTPFIATPAATSRSFDVPETAVPRTVAIGPLPGVNGWITVRQPQMEGLHFTPASLRLLEGVCYQASLAMQKARLYKDQKENADVANALLEFGRALSSATGLQEVLDGVAAQSARILGSPRTLVWLEDPESGDLVPRGMWGLDREEGAPVSELRVPAEIARRMLSLGEPFVADGELAATLLPADGDVRQTQAPSHAIAPLLLEAGGMGAITAAAPALGRYEFSERKMRLLTGIAHQARLAITNAWHFENLEVTFLATVEALANALEAKDEYTSSHARDIADMALKLGSEMGLDAQTLERLELGALFHDIGKIGIPSHILLKPGSLSTDEVAVVQTHPELGERILAPIARLEDVRPIVRSAHERYDGAGYPDGIAGESIPIESRIIFVCDAFHAMTTDRPYRGALSHEEACRRLRTNAGTQFDARVVDVFLRLFSGAEE